MPIPVLELKPRHSIGPFCLGSSRSEMREAAILRGLAFTSQGGRSDYFGPNAVQVEYDSDDSAWFIGASNIPSTYCLQFRGVDLFDASARDVYELFRGVEGESAPAFNPLELVLPRLIVTLWDADEQYDHVRIDAGEPCRPVWAQIGVGSEEYLARW